MKAKIVTTMSNALLIFIYSVFILLPNKIIAQNNSTELINIKGVVIGDDYALKSTKVKVYIDDELVIDNVLDENEFLLQIPVNEVCTVVFSQPTFIGKCIVFDTYSEKDIVHIDSFELVVRLISKSTYEGGELSALDFPVGIVKIDPDNNKLYYEELHSDYIWQMHKTGIEAKNDLKSN